MKKRTTTGKNGSLNGPKAAETVAEARRIVAFLNFRIEEARPDEQREVKKRVMQRIRTDHYPGAQAHRIRHYLSIAAAVGTAVARRIPRATIRFHHVVRAIHHWFWRTAGSQLPDQTRVTLNANSQLKFKKAWSEDHTREVWLEGEAFFEVVKQPDAIDGRFIVHTRRLDVEALGTSFNVRARDDKTQVVLKTGKVKLHPAHSSPGESDVFLEPGDMATLSDDRWVKTQVDPLRYSSWQDNRLFFNNESIRDIARRLKDTYGYEVTVEEPEWLDLTFTGSCPADDISILLTALSESFNLTVIRKNNTIMLQQPTTP